MGAAGTGKTFLMKRREELRRDVVLCATTGIAAINLGGSTINSLLGYFDTKGLRNAYVDGWLQGRIRKLKSSGIRRYIIDEMSMMDAEALDILVRAIDEVNLGEDPKRQVGLTLVGDFGQLGPIKAPFAFQADCWEEKFEPNLTILKENRRQSDQDFIEALHAARRGDGMKALEFFRDKLQPTKEEEFLGVTVLAKNDEVDRYNFLKLADCPGDEIQLLNSREGKQRGEWKNIPDRLDLKVGAVVMILANRRYPSEFEGDRPDYEYVNGDLGELVGLDQIGESKYPLVKLYRNGMTRPIRPVTREFLEPTGAMGVKKDRFVVTGSLTYFPLRLAYATTVHKVQGLTMDRVQVSFSNHFFGTYQMLYVALSRARNPEGLRLVGTPESFLLRCNADPRVARFL